MVVSNPLFRVLPSGTSALGLEPAMTCQDATSVAPFQLAYSWLVPSLLAPTASAGWVGGWAFQENR